MGQTTAIIEAEARRMPAIIRIVLWMDYYSSQNTIDAMRKNVRIAITIDILSKVEIIPKNGSFSFFVFFITSYSTILLHFLTNPLKSILEIYPSKYPLFCPYKLVLNPKVFSKQVIIMVF